MTSGMLRRLIEILSCETTLREQTQLIPKGIKCPPPPRIKKKKFSKDKLFTTDMCTFIIKPGKARVGIAIT